jgi:hypothetical protein
MHLYRAFGAWLQSALALPWLAGVEHPIGHAPADVTIRINPEASRAHAGLDPFFTSRWTMPNGEPFLRLHRRGQDVTLRFYDDICFVVRDDAIDVAWPEPDEAPKRHQAQIWLLGPVMAYWLERGGALALHASAVVMNGVAVAFAANSRGGKSTLAASFVQAGAALLTDDILPCRMEGERAISQPGFPGMRLWPAEAERFVGDIDDLDLVHPALDKRRADVGEGAFGRFHDAPAPVACIYLPARREEEAGPPRIEISPLNKRKALVELARMSFMGRMATAAFDPNARLDVLTNMAHHMTLKRLSYPSGHEHLPAVRAAVLADAAKYGDNG